MALGYPERRGNFTTACREHSRFIKGSDPFLSAVRMFGRSRHQVGILMEPKPEYAIDAAGDKQVVEFRNKMWREVEEANKEAPIFSHVFKEMILVTNKENTCCCTGKGSGNEEGDHETVRVGDRGTIRVRSREVTWTSPTLDWSQIGSRELVDACPQPSSRTALPALTSFSRIPPFDSSARDLIQLVLSRDTSATTNTTAEMEAMIAKYSVGLGGQKVNNDAEMTNGSSNYGDAHYTNGHAVLLTGTTGGLSSYLLASLLWNEDVKVALPSTDLRGLGHKQRYSSMWRVTLLNQSLGLTTIFTKRSIVPAVDYHHIAYCMRQLHDLVNVIIHNAWRLDFNLSLASFEANVRGTRSFIDLALSSKRSLKPRFLFTSSISSAQGWDKSKGAFPEEVRYDASVAAGVGYGAKWLTGFLVQDRASHRRWSRTDWVPIVVKTSVIMGALPEACGPAIKLLHFMRFLAQEDMVIRQSDGSHAEAAGFTSFVTDIAQRVRKMLRKLKALAFGCDEKPCVDVKLDQPITLT
ncbi:hypothetical protein BU15DRAFT_64353 [Melanogaster broomeanus]|nr:hypothetical protein BU15DRAFT_64353 [Melanogaster broomeanus]